MVEAIILLCGVVTGWFFGFSSGIVASSMIINERNEFNNEAQ